MQLSYTLEKNAFQSTLWVLHFGFLKDLTFATLMFICTSEQRAGRPGALSNKPPTSSTTVIQPHYSQQLLLLTAGQFTKASKRRYIGKKQYQAREGLINYSSTSPTAKRLDQVLYQRHTGSTLFKQVVKLVQRLLRPQPRGWLGPIYPKCLAPKRLSGFCNSLVHQSFLSYLRSVKIWLGDTFRKPHASCATRYVNKASTPPR